MPSLDLARRYFAAIEAGDIDRIAQCYADGAIVWSNIDRVKQSREESIRTLESFIAQTSHRAYRTPVLLRTQAGFAQKHVLAYRKLDGQSVELPCLILGSVSDGRITRLEQYCDNPEASPPTDLLGS